MKKVVKFGGSSLASAGQFKKAARIVRADKTRIYVVPSAPGKRFSSDTKVTDMLYRCYNLATMDDEYEEEFEEQMSAIRARYDEIIAGLGLSICQKIMREHKGIIWAENRSEGRIAFFLLFPAFGGQQKTEAGQ